MNGDIRLICFDLGRVLIRLCDGWHHACEVAGVPAPPPFTDEQRAKLQKLVHISEIGQMSQEEFCQSMSAIAARWSITLRHAVTPAQVVLCLMDLKMARLQRDPAHRDSMVDLIGYATILQQVTR